MAIDVITLALAKHYTNKTISGMGAIQGKSCQISGVKDGTHGKIITFAWYDSADVLQTTDVEIANGNGIKDFALTSEVDHKKTYTITYDDDTTDTLVVDDGKDVKVTIEQNSDGVYKLGFQVGVGAKIVTPDLKGNKFFSGEEVSSKNESGDNIVSVAGSKVGDLYFNTRNYNYYQRLDEHGLVNNWKYLGNYKGDPGLGFYDDTRKMPEYADKTNQEIFTMITGQAMPVRKVTGKPEVTDNNTLVNCLYYYQKDADISDIAKTFDIDILISKNVLPATSDIVAGKYAIEFTANDGTKKYAHFETTQTIPTYSNGDRYTYRIELSAGNSTMVGALPIIKVLRSAKKGVFYLATFDMYRGNVTISDTLDSSYVLMATQTMLPFHEVMRRCYICYSSPITEEVMGGTYSCWNGVKYYNFDLPHLVPVPDFHYRVYMDEIMMNGYILLVADDMSAVAMIGAIDTFSETAEPRGYIVPQTITEVGEWYQTIYAGSSLDNCAEITLKSGANLDGLITRDTFDSIVGAGELTTDKKAVKPAINELNALIRNDNGDLLNTTAKNLFGAVNELKQRDGEFKNLKTTEKSNLSGAINELFDKVDTFKALIESVMLPVGSIVFGTRPTYGTWQAYDFGGYVCSDLSLNDGRTMSERLPKPSIDGGGSHNHNYTMGKAWESGGSPNIPAYRDYSGAKTLYSSTDGYHSHSITTTSIYTDNVKTSNYNIEVRGKNVRAWIRTA